MEKIFVQNFQRPSFAVPPVLDYKEKINENLRLRWW